MAFKRILKPRFDLKRGFLYFWGDIMEKKTNLKKITLAALFCAVAYLCMFLFRFKVSFLTFDFKDAILAVSAFVLGPLYSVGCAITVALIEFISVSDTGVYGLIMNALSSSAFALICGLVYKYKRTLSGAVMGSVLAVIGMVSVMMVANIFITPYYSYMGAARSDVVALIPTLLLPFNITKGTVNASVTMIIYKPVTSALRKARLLPASTVTVDKKKFVLISVCSVIILAVMLIFLIFVMKGNISFGNN